MAIINITVYGYFWGSLSGLLITLILFFRYPKLRNAMVLNGICIAIMGVVLEHYFFRDYWAPPLLMQFGNFGGLEDLMFGFAAGSIGTAIPTLFVKTAQQQINASRIFFVHSLTLILQVLCISGAQKLGFNSIFGSGIGFLFSTLLLNIIQMDLLKKTVIGGVLGGAILILGEGILLRVFIPQYLEHYFLLYKTVPLLFGMIIPTELFWGICFGAYISIVANSRAVEYRQPN